MIKLERGTIQQDDRVMPMYADILKEADQESVEEYVDGLKQYIETHSLNAWVRSMFRKYPVSGRDKFKYRAYLIEQNMNLIEATFLSEKVSASR